MTIKTLSIRTVFAAALGMMFASMASCSGGDKAQALTRAAALADSVVSANGNANVEVNEAGIGLDATFRIADSLLNLQPVGQELFEIYAAQQLKYASADDINAVCQALRETEGDITVELVAAGQDPKTFTLTPRRIISLQRARLSQLDPAKAKEQVVKVAEGMCPNPKAHASALRTDVSVVKGFLEYNIVWPSERDILGKEQGYLTYQYCNAIKEQFIQMGDLKQPIIDLLTSLGIDGVRIVYSAEGTDRTVKQAFPWREIQKPTEEYNI